eukprot:15469242-Alexandrium_andersonii.AAC.1
MSTGGTVNARDPGEHWGSWGHRVPEHCSRLPSSGNATDSGQQCFIRWSLRYNIRRQQHVTS